MRPDGWKRIAALLAAAGCAACAGDDGGADATVVDATPTTAQLVDNRAWTVVAKADDPFEEPDDREITRCSDADVKVEDFPDGPWWDVSTAACNYATTRTPLLDEVRAGDTLRIRIWRFEMTVADGPFHVRVALGEPALTIYEQTIPAPTLESDLLFLEWEAPADFAAGEPVWWNIANHGSNTWSFIELSATGCDAPAPASCTP